MCLVYIVLYLIRPVSPYLAIMGVICDVDLISVHDVDPLLVPAGAPHHLPPRPFTFADHPTQHALHLHTWPRASVLIIISMWTN